MKNNKIVKTLNDIIATVFFVVVLSLSIALFTYFASILGLDDDTVVFAVFIPVALIVIFYKLFEESRDKKIPIRQLLRDKYQKALSFFGAFFSISGSVIRWLIKFALVALLVLLGVWIIIALGPLWIIAILLFVLVIGIFG